MWGLFIHSNFGVSPHSLHLQKEKKVINWEYFYLVQAVQAVVTGERILKGCMVIGRKEKLDEVKTNKAKVV